MMYMKAVTVQYADVIADVFFVTPLPPVSLQLCPHHCSCHSSTHHGHEIYSKITEQSHSNPLDISTFQTVVKPKVAQTKKIFQDIG